MREAALIPDRTSKPLITVLILNWNRRADLRDALRSVRAQTYRPLEILVVDNGSTDGSTEGFEIEFPEIRIIRLGRNYGCPGGRNIGIQYATGDFIFFLDNDGVLDSRAIEKAYNVIQQSDKVAIVTGRVILYANGKSWVPSRIGIKHTGKAFVAPTFAGGASLHRSSIFREVGMFPSDYIYGGEESDLALRLIEKGYLILYEPSVIMYHKMSAINRNHAWNFVCASMNILVSAWRHYPLEIAILFTLRTFFVWSVRAIQRGAFLPLVLNTPQCVKRVFETIANDRTPVRRRTMRIVHTLHTTLVTSMDELIGAGAKFEQYTTKQFLHMLLLFR